MAGVGKPDRLRSRHSEVQNTCRLHQTGFTGRFSWRYGLLTAQWHHAEWMTGIVTRENPIRRATCNPARAGFYRIVEIRPDPDSRIGYPSIPNIQVCLWTTSWRQFKSSCHHISSVITLATGDEVIKFWKFKGQGRWGGMCSTELFLVITV